MCREKNIHTHNKLHGKMLSLYRSLFLSLSVALALSLPLSMSVCGCCCCWALSNKTFFFLFFVHPKIFIYFSLDSSFSTRELIALYYVICKSFTVDFTILIIFKDMFTTCFQFERNFQQVCLQFWLRLSCFFSCIFVLAEKKPLISVGLWDCMTDG